MTIFDVLPVWEFDKGESSACYRERSEQLDRLAEELAGSENVGVIDNLYQGTDQSRIWEFLDEMVVEDKEGLMVNLDVPYKCRRHNGILKVKRFYTMDLPIVSCEEGSGRLAGILGALVVSLNGDLVRVGSGFTDAQRISFWENRENLVGTLCEVKYKEISSDKTTGSRSLQFPVFVSLRTDKEDVSYG